jgi:gamma-glutamyltranspeptidase/glutathione hydrolase
MRSVMSGAPTNRSIERLPKSRRVVRGVSVLMAVTLVFFACAHREDPRDVLPAATLDAVEAHSDHGMVSTGSEEATMAGVEILERGGNAVDAAVAAAFALGVADPGGSGLGGMTYILISPARGRPIAVDGSSTVPVGSDREKLLELHNSGESFGAKAIAVPATLAALDHALGRYGTMDLAAVLEPAIRFAEEGSRLNANSIAWTTGYLDDILASSFYRFVVLEDGVQVGSLGRLFCRPDLAATLGRLAVEGPQSFYRGTIARAMLVDLVERGGFIQPADLALMRAQEIQPILSTYRHAEVISYPWPGGGREVARGLEILENFSPELLSSTTSERLHVTIEVSRLALADTIESIHRPASLALGVDVSPTQASARQRADLITPGKALAKDALQTFPGGPRMGEHTTHVSVADRWGNAVSLTQTLCRQHGTKLATPGLGFPYNSCLEFFEFEDSSNPFYLQPRARYSSTMAPTIVRYDGGLLVLGSAGSDRIPGSVTEVVSNVVDRGMGIREAVTAPRVLWNSAHDPDRVCIEITDWITSDHADTLQRWGFENMFRLEYPATPAADSAFFGGVNAVMYNSASGRFTGVGDPRRSGVAEGPRAVRKTTSIRQ